MRDSRQQSTTGNPFLFLMVSSTDHVSPVTGITPTVTLSKDGGSFAAAAGAISEVGNGWYALAGNATDRNTLGELAVHATGTGADPFDGKILIVPFNMFDAVRLGLTALPNAAAEAAGGLITRGTGAGQVNQDANGRIDTRTVAMANDVVTAAAVANGAIDAATFAAGAIDAAAIADNAIDAGAIAANAITSAKIAADAIGATQIASDAITAAKIAPDAIGSSEFATSAVNEIRDAIVANGPIDASLLDVAVSTRSSAAALQIVDDFVDDLETRLTATRAGFLDNLNVGGLVASSAEATSIQNNTRVVRVVPSVFERPDSGTTQFRIELALYDEIGNMEAPDSAPTVAVVNQGGTSRDGNLDSTTMALVSTGRYRALYSVDTVHALEQLIFTFTVVEGGVTRNFSNNGQVVDTTAVDFTSADRTMLQTLHDVRLTAGRAANLDNLNATITSRSAPGDAMDLVADAVDGAAVAASAVSEFQSGLATAAAVAGVQSDVDDIQTRLPAALVSGRMDSSVGAMAAGVVTAAAVGTGAIDADALATDAATEIAGAVDTQLSGTHGGGAWGGGGGLSQQNVRDAMMLAPSAGTPAAGSVDEHLDDIDADTTAILADTSAIDTRLPPDPADESNTVAGFVSVLARLPAALVGGRMDSSVGAIAGGALSTIAAAAAAAVRDIAVVGSAPGSLGEGVLVSRNSKVAYRIDNFSRNPLTGFATGARMRIFATQAAANASTPGAPNGTEGELVAVDIAGTADGTFPALPADVLGGS